MVTLNYTTNYAPSATNHTWVVPLVVAIITICGIAATLYVQNRNFKRQIKSNSATKIAEMRQAWINNLRNELASFPSHFLSTDEDPLPDQSTYERIAKIQLMMNPLDGNYKRLTDAANAIITSENRIQKHNAHKEYISVCQEILKTEWEVLKSEINTENQKAPAHCCNRG